MGLLLFVLSMCDHLFIEGVFVFCDVDRARTSRCLMPMSQRCGWRFRPAGFVWLCMLGLSLLRWFWEIASLTDAAACCRRRRKVLVPCVHHCYALQDSSLVAVLIASRLITLQWCSWQLPPDPESIQMNHYY